MMILVAGFLIGTTNPVLAVVGIALVILSFARVQVHAPVNTYPRAIRRFP